MMAERTNGVVSGSNVEHFHVSVAHPSADRFRHRPRFPNPAVPFCRFAFLALAYVAAAFTTAGSPLRPSEKDSVDLAIQTWNLEEGLPNSTVTAVTQTADGYLWIGTFNGLARFDGVRFVTFNPGNTPAMKQARIQRLYVDSQDTLWINTYDGALISFRDGTFTAEWKSEVPRSSKIELVPSRSGDIVFAVESGELIRRPVTEKAPGKWRVQRPPVDLRENTTYVEDRTGMLWCLTRDKRIWQVTGDHYELVATEKTLGGPFRRVRIVADSSGALCITAGEKFLRWDGHCFHSIAPPQSEGAVEMQYVFFPRAGGAWMVANERFRQIESRQWTDEVHEWKNLLPPDFPIYQQMHEDRRGGLWFAPPHRGVFYRSPDGKAAQLTTKDGLPGDFITSWFEDREGNIWLGVEHGGLVRLRQKRFQTLSLGGDLPSAPAIAVCEDRDHAIWVGTFGNGLVRATPGRTERFFASAEPTGRYAFSVIPDAAGRIWTSAGGEDLHLVAGEKLEPKHGSIHGIKVLFADRRNRLWIGTKAKLFCVSNLVLQNFDAFKNIREEVRAIAEDRDGHIWAGLGSGSLYRYDDREFVAFKPDDVPETYPIWSLCADDDGSLWVGTFGGGLLRMKEGKFFRYTKKHGLPDDVICQILDDQDGNLWIGSHQGVFRLNKEALRACAEGKITTVPSLVFGRHDGLPSLECTGGYQPSAWRAHDGTLWFATAGGAASIVPSKLAANPSPPSVKIESAIIDGGPPALGGVKRSADGSHSGTLVIPAGGKHLELQYTGLCFASPDQVRFRYQLEGLEKNWIEVGPRRSAQYSYLRPGNYRFLVSACNSDGIWNEAGAALKIRVLPYFWETWWFIGLFGTTTIGAIAAAVHRLSTRKLRRKLHGVERARAIEEDRARIARDIHDDLGAGLTQITLFTELLRRAPSDRVEEHVRQIAETADSLTRAMDEIVWAVNPKNDSLENLVGYICSFAQEYLRGANVKCRLEMPAQLPAMTISSEMRHHLFVSVKEALNNILKHASASEVWLRLSLERDTFTLAIEDNGCGLRLSAAGEPAGSRHCSGNGLDNLKSRLREIGGECLISSGRDGQGIRISMKAPLGAEPTDRH